MLSRRNRRNKWAAKAITNNQTIFRFHTGKRELSASTGKEEVVPPAVDIARFDFSAEASFSSFLIDRIPFPKVLMLRQQERPKVMSPFSIHKESQAGR